MATFGDTGSGNTTFPCSNDRAIAGSFTLVEAATVTQINVRFDASSTAGTSFKGLIYADSAGLPGALLATSSAVVVPAGGGDLGAAMSASLAAGTYWLGSVTSSFEAVWRADTVTGGQRQEALTYASPAATFGTPAGSTGGRLCVYVTYVSGPTITSQPADVVAKPGATAAFTVAATGTGGLTYQWQKQQGGAWSNVSGATSASYTTSTLTAADSAGFRCNVTDTNGTSASSAASLTVAASRKVWRFDGRGGRLVDTEWYRPLQSKAVSNIASSDFFDVFAAQNYVIATLAGVSQTSAGQLLIKGTAANTLAGATVASTGQLPIKGTAATTLAGATMTATATLPALPISATVTATLGGVTQTGKGIHGNSPTASSAAIVIDAPIFKSSPTTNLGTSGVGYTGVFDAVSESRVLFKFDMSAPTGSPDVANAAMSLTLSQDSVNAFRITGYRVLRAWTEAGVTWNTYDGTNAWTVPGANGAGDIDPVPVFVVDVPPSLWFAVIQFGGGAMNTLVEGWLSGAFANNGLLLTNEAVTPVGEELTTYSGNAGAHNPQLAFDYQTPYTGSTAITGTLSATLAGATVTSFAKLDIAATVASTLAGATVASTGALIGKLNAAQTLPAFTQTATVVASNAATITAAQTLPAFGQTATAVAIDALTAAQTLPAFSQTATMSAPSILTLTASQTLPAFTQTATALATAGLTAAQTLPAFNQTATAAAVAALNASQTLPAFGQTATAVVVAVGSAVITAAQTLPAFGQTATVTTTIALTAAQTLPAFGQTAAAAVRAVATAAQTLPAFGQTATASASATLTAAQTLPAFSQTATAVQVRTATAAQTLPAFSQTATAVAIDALTAAQTLPAFGQTATMSAPTARVVTASQTLPAFGQTATAVARIVLNAVQTMPAFTQYASLQSGAALYTFVANERTYTPTAEQRSFAPNAESRRAVLDAENRRHLVPVVSRIKLVN